MLTIKVTQEDIDKGQKGTCWNCPVALALQRQIRTFNRIGVTYSRIWLGYNQRGREVSVPIPPEILEFVSKFDAGEPVKPFSFSLNVPADLTRFSDS